MKFLDKIKDLFSDEEEVIETREIEVEENEEHQLPTFMRNKIEEEQKRKEEAEKKQVENSTIISDRNIIKERNNNFSFPIDIDDNDFSDINTYNKQNVLLKERTSAKEKSLSDLYAKKEEPKPKKFKPTPVISPVYGVLDKNYTKDEVKVQDETAYEIQRPSRKIDFETVRNKAFGTLSDDIRNNLCENCELYQEVKITKNADKIKTNKQSDNLLSDLTEDTKEDITLETAEENYFDYGVSYEPPKKEPETVVNIDELEITNNIKIINHNNEESTAEKIEVKEPIVEKQEDKDLEELTHEEETIESILSKEEDNKTEEMSSDIFNLLDSMYDEEEK